MKGCIPKCIQKSRHNEELYFITLEQNLHATIEADLSARGITFIDPHLIGM
ncbi:MAG: hypothetical protein LW832_01360 [Parachlamydia sp.]|nr:hypothetical protein [Parachlamydia sp.]